MKSNFLEKQRDLQQNIIKNPILKNFSQIKHNNSFKTLSFFNYTMGKTYKEYSAVQIQKDGRETGHGGGKSLDKAIRDAKGHNSGKLSFVGDDDVKKNPYKVAVTERDENGNVIRRYHRKP